MKGYGVGDTIKNFIFVLYTKLFWKRARLVRLPILARNRQNISFGEGFTCGVGCRLNPGEQGKIVIGKNFVMGDYCQIEAMEKVQIGDNVLLASRVYIGDAVHGNYNGTSQSSPESMPNARSITTKGICIGNNVWIGNSVSILKGVSIGNGSIIGAGSVVTHDLPSHIIAVGSPARAIKRWDGDKWVKKCNNIVKKE